MSTLSCHESEPFIAGVALLAHNHLDRGLLQRGDTSMVSRVCYFQLLSSTWEQYLFTASTWHVLVQPGTEWR